MQQCNQIDLLLTSGGIADEERILEFQVIETLLAWCKFPKFSFQANLNTIEPLRQPTFTLRDFTYILVCLGKQYYTNVKKECQFLAFFDLLLHSKYDNDPSNTTADTTERRIL